MKEFLLVYRGSFEAMPKESPEEMQAATQKWMNWFAGLSAQNKFVSGNHLNDLGRVVKRGDAVSDGPYTEIKESIMGFTLIKAASFDEATTLVKDCPILSYGGNVEIRGMAGCDYN